MIQKDTLYQDSFYHNVYKPFINQRVLTIVTWVPF